jgi:hypothetical protein
MRGYNNIMLYFWLAIGFLLLIIISYLSITEGFGKWGFYYVFVGLCFLMFFMRKWMMKRMDKHMKYLEEQGQNKPGK